MKKILISALLALNLLPISTMNVSAAAARNVPKTCYLFYVNGVLNRSACDYIYTTGTLLNVEKIVLHDDGVNLNLKYIYHYTNSTEPYVVTTSE